MKLPPKVDDGHERIGYLVCNNLYARLVRHIDQQPGEQEPVQLGLLSRSSALVQLDWLLQVVEHAPGVRPPGFELLDGLIQLGFYPGALVPDAAELLGELGFGPFRVQGQLDVAVLVPFQFGEPPADPGPVLNGVAVAQLNGSVEQLDQLLAEFGWQDHRLVVARYGLLKLGCANVWQIADLLLPAAADEVEVQLAGLALPAHHDEASVAPLAPDQTLEVVVVSTLTVAGSWHRTEHLLDALKQLRRD